MRLRFTFNTAVIILAFGTSLSVACTAQEFPNKSIEAFKSEDFRTRESGQATLLEWSRKNPAPAMDRLFVLSQTAEEPEVRERCLEVLRELVGDEYSKEGEGYMGVRMQDETETIPGDAQPRSVVRILEVVQDSPSHHAGMKVNDLIVGLNGKIWRNGVASQILMQSIRELKPGDVIKLPVLRDGQVIEFKVKLTRRPLLADNPFLAEQQLDMEAAEKAAKEAYFRRWLDARRARE